MTSMTHNDYGMGGAVVSYQQQQRNERDIQDFEQHLQQKRKRQRKKIKQQESEALITTNLVTDISRISVIST